MHDWEQVFVQGVFGCGRVACAGQSLAVPPKQEPTLICEPQTVTLHGFVFFGSAPFHPNVVYPLTFARLAL